MVFFHIQGRRPFGLSTFICGFDDDSTGEPQLLLTEPSGSCSKWKAHAIGRNSKNLRAFLEKHYEDDLTDEQTISLAIETMTESVESEKHIEIQILRKDQPMEKLTTEQVEAEVKKIKEKNEAD